MDKIYAGMEAGGTKCICAIGTGPGDLRSITTYQTTTPEETLMRAVDFFQSWEEQNGKLDALGVASFGPVDPHPDSATFGFITNTPKPDWANSDIVGYLREYFTIPIGFDTDVNGAALGEWHWGAAMGLDTFIYLTIGTGIGGGGQVNGKLMHGMIHPEMGHIRIPHDKLTDPFEGICPYHGDCLEGLASGPALEKFWGAKAEVLPQDHPAWDREALFLAFGLVNFICTISPQRIIMGGGVMKQTHLFPLIRSKVLELLNGYVKAPQITNKIEEYIVPPVLGSQAGVLGAIALAIDVAVV